MVFNRSSMRFVTTLRGGDPSRGGERMCDARTPLPLPPITF